MLAVAARRSTFAWILESVSLLVLFAIFGILLAHWADLPQRVPDHFDAWGKPNRWGDKHGLLLLPLTALGVYVLLTVASRYQKLINIPMTVDRNAPEVQSLLLEMSIVLKMILLFVFLHIVGASVNTALGNSDGLGKAFLPVSLAASFLPLCYYLFRLRKYSQ